MRTFSSCVICSVSGVCTCVGGCVVWYVDVHVCRWVCGVVCRCARVFRTHISKFSYGISKTLPLVLLV